MKQNRMLAVLAGLLVLGMWTLSRPHADSNASVAHAIWTIFLVLIPVGLGAMALRNLHWAAMACVIYGTVGFALDVATAVQIITKDTNFFTSLMVSGISGFLNFVLILLGGQAFLDGFQAPSPPGSRPPNPPSSA